MHHRQRHEAHRQRDEEDPAPVGVVGDPPAAEGAEHGGDSEDRAGEALPAAPVRGRHEVADHRHREGDQRAGPETLDRAREDDLRHGVGRAAHDRAGHEEEDPATKNGRRP